MLERWFLFFFLVLFLSLSLCRQKLRSSGGLDGLESLWGGAVGAHDGYPEWMGGSRTPAENAELCKNRFQINISNCDEITDEYKVKLLLHFKV